MSEYHVGCGLSAIYAGTVLRPGVWRTKSPVTDEALSASAQFLLINHQEFNFKMNGKWYRMEVTEVPEEVTECAAASSGR